MRRFFIILILLVISSVLLVGCTTSTKTHSSYTEPNCEVKNMKSLVVYFSCTGTTKNIAEKIANASNSTIFRLEPSIPYTSKDLEYYTNCRADKEQSDVNCRVEILKNIDSINDYDVIYIGYPIWHSLAPRIIYTFLESFDFSNKTIVPFCTYGSSGISTSVNDIRHLLPNVNILSGKRFDKNASLNDIQNYLNSLNLN